MRRFPAATIGVAILLAAVSYWQFGLDPYHDLRAVLAFGVVPAQLWGLAVRPPEIDLIPAVATLVTAQGLHGGLSHLLGNVVALVFVGPTAEAKTGGWRLLAIFLIAGAAGLAVEAAAAPSSTMPILGASASVAGIIGAAARRDPHARVGVVIPARGFRLRRLAIPLLPLVAVWLVIQVAGLAFERGEPVAFLAHATGFVVGVLMAGSTRWGPRPVE
jgi:membrane associated rhomboid family serine protease